MVYVSLSRSRADQLVTNQTERWSEVITTWSSFGVLCRCGLCCCCASLCGLFSRSHLGCLLLLLLLLTRAIQAQEQIVLKVEIGNEDRIKTIKFQKQDNIAQGTSPSLNTKRTHFVTKSPSSFSSSSKFAISHKDDRQGDQTRCDERRGRLLGHLSAKATEMGTRRPDTV